MTKRLFRFLFVCTILLLLCPVAFAAEEEAQQVTLTADYTGFQKAGFLTDGNVDKYFSAKEGSVINLSSDVPFSSLYIMFDLEYGEYIITDNTNNLDITAGTYSYLHEFIPLPKPTTSVTVYFSDGYVSLSEIRAYTAGTPSGIQIWEPPLEGDTDLLLMSTHGDDEHLFFAGLLPIYAAEQDYNVQVAYLTNHREWTRKRCHEMLNGLWAVGVRNYPMFGTFKDFRIDNRDATYYTYEANGTSKEELLSYVVEQIRRFRPQVVVGHDFKGEYGHGMHQVYADLVSQAVFITNDPNYFPESAEKYGLWDVPKTYFHVYPENSVELELDAPLEAFGGMSAFDVSRYIGFPQHESQQQFKEFTHWIYGPQKEVKDSKDIRKYSPRYYGLYRTTVGPDSDVNDLMENTKLYNERKRLEAERLAAEEAARLEAIRLEEERKAAEEAAALKKRLEEKRLKEEAEARAQERKQLTLILIATGVLVLLFVLGSITAKISKKKKDC